ncbi:MAG TPA: hypothetical protein VFJ85_18370 [Acidimicrobiales bacterium]|nr:hypothetical protein [Acidimicrobiales bacterium]
MGGFRPPVEPLNIVPDQHEADTGERPWRCRCGWRNEGPTCESCRARRPAGGRRARKMAALVGGAPSTPVWADPWVQVGRATTYHLSLHQHADLDDTTLAVATVDADSWFEVPRGAPFRLHGEARPGAVVVLAGHVDVVPLGRLEERSFEERHRSPEGTGPDTVLVGAAPLAPARARRLLRAGTAIRVGVPLAVLGAAGQLLPDGSAPAWSFAFLVAAAVLVGGGWAAVAVAARRCTPPGLDRRRRRAWRTTAAVHALERRGAARLAADAGLGPASYRRLRRLLRAWAAVAVAAGLLVAGGRILSTDEQPAAEAPEQTAPPEPLLEEPAPPALDADGDPVLTPVPPVEPGPARSALPAALTAPPPPGGPVVTPAAAEAVARAMWALRGDALNRLDPAELRGFETGTALEVDAGRCPCPAGNPFGPARAVAVTVPRQDGFPAQFLAQVATTDATRPYLAFLVLRRETAADPWRLAFAGGFHTDKAAVTPPAPDPDGYALAPDAPPAVDPDGVHAALADLWRVARRTGTVPPTGPFEPGRWTDEYAKVLAARRQGAAGPGGLVSWIAFQAGAGAFTFPEAGGWRIVCSAIRTQTTYTGPEAGKGPVQDPALATWGPDVPEGVHRAVTVTALRTPCIEVPPAGSGAQARVLGADEHVVATSYQ